MKQRPIVHDLDFLGKLALANVPENDYLLLSNGYYSGQMAGLNIAKVFVNLNALSLREDVWRLLKGEVYPTPSIEEFIQGIAYGTFETVQLERSLFYRANLRYGVTGNYYSTGLADASLVGIVEIPRALMLTLGDRWRPEALRWLNSKVIETASKMPDAEI